MEIIKIIHIVDIAVFIITAISVLYIFVFALSSAMRNGRRYKVAAKKMRFLVLIPSYKDDLVIRDSVNSVLASDYPGEKLQTVVISDKMEDATNEWLTEQPITLFTINPDKSSKAYALNFAIENLDDKNFDIVVILDSDNIIDEEFFNEINNAFYSGSTAVQIGRAHV